MKSFLITTSAPYLGTEQHYRAYAVENPYDSGKLDDWFWDIETENLLRKYEQVYRGILNGIKEEW